MKLGNLDNKFDTVTMSPTVRQRLTRTQLARNSSEERFLADQAAAARTAIMQTVQEMKHTLGQAAAVRTCARQHPWIATGSAVAAGFITGALLPGARSTAGMRTKARTVAG